LPRRLDEWQKTTEVERVDRCQVIQTLPNAPRFARPLLPVHLGIGELADDHRGVPFAGGYGIR
jgi:hypothetical protein